MSNEQQRSGRAHVAQREPASPQWLNIADEIAWHRKPRVERTVDAHGSAMWFPDGELNICANALDRHVEAGHGADLALIHDSAMTGARDHLSYKDLLARTALFAGALRARGVRKGDRVVIYMPMIPEAVIAMLACARLGAVHSVVFGGFAAPELAARIADSGARVIVTASGGIEPARRVEYVPILQQAIELSGSMIETVVIKHRNGFIAPVASAGPVSWEDWDRLCAGAVPADPVPVRSTDPLYILYTSGTTGAPKGVVRDTGGYAVALTASMETVYKARRGDVFWAASDIGWVVGHSYIVYAPLLIGAATVLYEGKPVGTPDAGAYWRVIEEHGVNVLFTAPTAIRAIHKADPNLDLERRHDIRTLRTVFVAGERLDPETWHWICDRLQRPIIDHWWQTETGWPVSGPSWGAWGSQIKPGSAGRPVPGFDVRILDQGGRELSRPGVEGNVALALPLPPGALVGVWGAPSALHERYLSAFPGYFSTGDSGYLDKDGFLFVMGRTDDVINVAGHRLSTGALEEVIGSHPSIAECAVVGARDALKGQRAVAYVCMTNGAGLASDRLRRELITLVRDHVGPVAAFRDIIVVERLPKTRSGKLLRRTLRQIFDGEQPSIPPTIEDPTVVDDMHRATAAYRSAASVAGDGLSSTP